MESKRSSPDLSESILLVRQTSGMEQTKPPGLASDVDLCSTPTIHFIAKPRCQGYPRGGNSIRSAYRKPRPTRCREAPCGRGSSDRAAGARHSSTSIAAPHLRAGTTTEIIGSLSIVRRRRQHERSQKRCLRGDAAWEADFRESPVIAAAEAAVMHHAREYGSLAETADACRERFATIPRTGFWPLRWNNKDAQMKRRRSSRSA